jgi:Flp pilus assembly protein TadD
MTDVANYRNLITRFASSGQWERALKTAREWLSVEPENSDAHYAAGRALVVLNRHAEAERNVNRVLAARPGHGPSHRLIADIHFAAGRFKTAEESIRKAISLDPTDAIAWYELARICYEQGDESSAKEYAVKASELSPRNPDIMNLIAACEPVDSSTVGRKLARHREALELDPTHAATHENLGICHLHYTGDYQGAEESFRRALFFDPACKTAHSNLFLTLKNRDRVYRALHAPKDSVLKFFASGSIPRINVFLDLLLLPIWLLIFSFALAFWSLLFWPLLKAYEYLTIGDIRSSAGEVAATRGGFLGYRRLSLKIRLAIFAVLLGTFWGGAVWLFLHKQPISIKTVWKTLGWLYLFFALLTCLLPLLSKKILKNEGLMQYLTRIYTFARIRQQDG